MGNRRHFDAKLGEIQRRKRKSRARMGALAAVVALVTAFALIVPAMSITAEKATPEAGFFAQAQRSGQAADAQGDGDDAGDAAGSGAGGNAGAASGGGASENGASEDADSGASAGGNGDADSGAGADGSKAGAGDAADDSSRSGETEGENGAAGAGGDADDGTGAGSEGADGDGNADGDGSPGGDASADASDSFAMPAQKFEEELKDVDNTDDPERVLLTVKVDAPQGALPQGTTMRVAKVDDKKVIRAAKAQAAEDADIDKARARTLAVDITFQDADGNDVEPAGQVRVTMSAPEVSDIAKPERMAVVHVDDERKAEVLDADERSVELKKKREEVTFDAEAFSAYVVVYTVDFAWQVDGREVAYSIPGGSYASLSHLVEALGLAKSDEAAGMSASQAAREFVADVAAVEFSAPDLVAVARVDADTTVGDLKDALGLECTYSADLTDEQIAAINAQELAAGDWALISLTPFSTEETLTVTMADGAVWTVRVTDAQVQGESNIADQSKYLIYYTSGNTHYVLRKDGTVTPVTNTNDLDTLSDDYLWTFDRNSYGMTLPFSGYYEYDHDYTVHNGGTCLTLDGSSEEIITNSIVNCRIEEKDDASGGFRFYTRKDVLSGGWGQVQTEYRYLAFDTSSKKFKLVDSETNTTRIKLWEQKARPYTFTVKAEYNNVYRGTVSGTDKDGTNKNKVASYTGITNNDKTNKNKITATPGQGYTFKEWRLGDKVLDVTWSGDPATIPAKAIKFPDDNMVLTAVFEKIPNTPGFPDYSDLINQWKAKNTQNPLTMDKTAKVVDYDNRIYEIDLSAQAAAKIIVPSIDLAFVTDVSRSMYFPAELGSPITYRNTDAPGTVNGYTNAKDFVVKILDSYRNKNWAEENSADKDSVYYLIGDPEGSSTVYAVRYDASAKKWKYIDASYDVTTYNDKKDANKTGTWTVSDKNGKQVGWNTLSDQITWNVNKKRLELEGKALDGKIYVAKDVRYRLDYLQQAVDIVSEVVYEVNPSAKTGLATFAKEAKGPFGLYDKKDYGTLVSELNDISPDGGTNHQAGLKKAEELWNADSDKDRQRVVILITDGAPNPGNWTDIAEQAGTLNKNTGAVVHTIGLSIDDVKGAEQGLKNTAQKGGGGKALKAKNGTELVQRILEIADTFLTEVQLKGSIQDTLDPAFYPVKQNGDPIAPGYYNESGNPIDASDIPGMNKSGTPYSEWVYNNQMWTVTWHNVEIGRGTSQSPATHKNILVKAKEDFLGGNKIKTNAGNAKTIATQSVRTVSGQQKVEPLEVNRQATAETPYVNVDELHLTEHSTEWTVYLGTSVTPEEQLRALWNNIRVKQVVKKDGVTDDGAYMTGGTQKWYGKADAADADAPDKDYASLPITYFITEENFFAGLMNDLKTKDSVERSVEYQGYGHMPGTIKVKVEKAIDDGAKDANGKAPETHVVDMSKYPSDPTETYKITVTYEPKITGATDEYKHTTAGGKSGKVTNPNNAEDKVVSENMHVINVVKKGLEIRKHDDNGNLIDKLPATFKLYRPAQTGEVGATVTGLGEGFVEVASLTTDKGAAKLDDALQELRKLSEGHYYLVEEAAPEGFEKLISPIQLDVSVTDGEQTMPYEQSEGITDLVNVGAPTAKVSTTNATAEVLADEDGRFVVKVINKSAAVDIDIHKVDDKGAALPGATFKIVRGSQTVQVAASGTGVIVEPKVAGETVEIKDNTFTIPAGGVTIRNLTTSEAEYEIVEVAPPAGFNILDDAPVKFKVSAGAVTDVTKGADVTYESKTNGFTIPNTPGKELPNTGGMGTVAFTVIGLLLICGAGAYLLLRRRK